MQRLTAPGLAFLMAVLSEQSQVRPCGGRQHGSPDDSACHLQLEHEEHEDSEMPAC